MNKPFLQKLFLLKVKFASSSAIATAVDYIIFLILVNRIFAPVLSHVISASCGMVINFLLQKKYIFQLNRKVSQAFIISVIVSIGGILLGSVFIFTLNKVEFFADRPYLAKLLVTGTIFFYNFYLKRFAFEKKFF